MEGQQSGKEPGDEVGVGRVAMGKAAIQTKSGCRSSCSASIPVPVLAFCGKVVVCCKWYGMLQMVWYAANGMVCCKGHLPCDLICDLPCMLNPDSDLYIRERHTDIMGGGQGSRKEAGG